MPQTLIALLREPWSAFRPADALDIALVAGFVYAAISWFRRAKSRFVITGLAALVGLYFVARVLDMFLTLFLFQVGITVALVALVVIFQEDIRRAFERLARPRVRDRRVLESRPAEVVEIVVEAAFNLARKRSGALLVFRGKEPLARHAVGGVRLDGKLSQALLDSIFDAGSSGHDGAVIVEGDLVTRFGVHLPLSTSARADEGLGTRHAAALGLAERSDAFVIVVSEERGEVRVAHDGDLVRMGGAPELTSRLAAFLGHVAPERGLSLLGRVLTRDLGAKALSILVAVSAWGVLFGYEREVVARTFEVPIVYRNVPPGWLIDEPKPLEARVTLAGTDRAFAALDARALDVALDVAQLHAGAQQIVVGDADLEHAEGLSVHRIEPRSITVVAHETVQIEAPIKPDLTGKPGAAWRYVGVSVEPKMISIIVPREGRAKLGEVRTAPIDLASIRGTMTLAREVLLPGRAQLAEGMPREVAVTVEVEPVRAK